MARAPPIAHRKIMFNAAVLSAPVDENQLRCEEDVKTGRLQINTEEDMVVEIEAEVSSYQ